jgi:hypothetical protein
MASNSYVAAIFGIVLIYGALAFLAYAILSRWWEDILVLLKVIGAFLAIGCAIAWLGGSAVCLAVALICEVLLLADQRI